MAARKKPGRRLPSEPARPAPEPKGATEASQPIPVEPFRPEDPLRKLTEELQHTAERTADLQAAIKELQAVIAECQHLAAEQERTQRLLRESQERLRAIVDTAVDAIITIDRPGVIESVNPSAEKMFGYAAVEMLGRNVSLLMPSPYREEHDRYLANYLKTGVQKIIGLGREVRARRKDGSTFPADLAVSEIDHLRLFTGILRDITSRKQLEREVLEIAALEQRRIGQELHDGVGQELTGLSLMAEALVQRLKDSGGGGELAAKVAAGLERLHQQVRSLSRGLIPVEVDPEGLRGALQDLAIRTSEQSGMVCTFNCSDPVQVSLGSAVTATHLFRIAQEAVNNALRHSRARHIHIALNAEAATLTLSVRDDGIGFPGGPLDETRGLGVRIMRNRAGLIGGTLTIGPAESGGTLVTCILSRGNNHG